MSELSRTLEIAVLGGCLAACALGGATAGAEGRWSGEPKLVLPPGLERRAVGLLGPVAKSKQLPGGWRLESISIQARAIRYRFGREGKRLALVLSAPAGLAARRSKNFSIALDARPTALSLAERQALLQTVARLIQRHDTGPSPWKIVKRRDSYSPLGRSATQDGPAWYDLRDPTWMLQVLMLLVLVGLGTRARWLASRLRAVGWVDGALLGALSLMGLGLRLLYGLRIPAWINNHGYELLNEVLVRPPRGADPHGNTYNAVHGLVMTVLPTREWVVVATQMAMSVAIIPLVYLVSRAWLKERRWALWAALVAAVLPVSVYFAASEVRTVSGAFFLLLSLAALGWCVRDPHPVPRFVTAILAVLTTQVYPILMVVPVVLLLAAWTAPKGRRLLRQPWTWVAAVVGLALYATGAVRILSQLIWGTGIHGPGYLHTLGGFPKLLAPTWSFSNASCNVFLNHHFTPPLLWLCGLAALVAAFLKRVPRGPVVALGASALLLTLVGLVGGRMNSARIQLPALPLYCLVAGVGLGLLGDRLVRLVDRLATLSDHLVPLKKRRATIALVTTAALVGLSVLLWPGPITLRGTPQLQHRVIAEGLARIDRRCAIVHPSDGSTPIGRLPVYLHGPSGHRFRWFPFAATDIKSRLEQRECLIYYRPVDCYERTQAKDTPIDENGLVGVCTTAERHLTLRPLYTRALPAIPDNEQIYTRKNLTIGFFAIELSSPPARPR